jgi:Transposase DDE domain
VLRLSPEVAVRAAKVVHRKRSRRYAQKLLLPLTVRAAGYLMLLTSLPPSIPAAEVLEAYRLRWRLELAFKRLKSLLGFGRLRAKGGALARSWLPAHLVFALLIDDTAQGLLAVPPHAAGSTRKLPPPLALARDADAA